jgi:hypothetical protein
MKIERIDVREMRIANGDLLCLNRHSILVKDFQRIKVRAEKGSAIFA